MRARPADITIRLLATVLVAVFAVSCSRDLPTSPSRSATPAQRAAAHRFDIAMLSRQVVVVLAPGVDPAEVAASYGASVVDYDQNEGIASLLPGSSSSTSALLSSLSGDSRVATSETNNSVQSVESSQKSFAFDDGLGTPQTYAEQPAGAEVQLDLAHQTTIGLGVKIAMLDTGIDPTHPALAGHITAAYDFVDNQPGATDVPLGVDTNGDGTVDGAYGHGTHIAGIALLSAPGAQLLVGRVLDSDGVGDVMSVASGIRWAVANGAKIISLSLGTSQESEAIDAALEEASAHGVLVIAAAGNHGAEYPQDYPAVSSLVSAVAACDAYGSPAPWTSYGTYVSMSAPGVAVRSAYPGGGYVMWSGTSMAAPFVAGCAALLLQQHPDWTPAQLMSTIRQNADPFVTIGSTQIGKLGAGILDMARAVALPDPTVDATVDGGGVISMPAPGGRH